MAKKFPPTKSSKKVRAIAEKRTRTYLFDLIMCYQEDIGELISSAKAAKLTTDQLRQIALPLSEITSFISARLGRKGAGRAADAVAQYAESIGARFERIAPSRNKTAKASKKRIK